MFMMVPASVILENALQLARMVASELSSENRQVLNIEVHCELKRSFNLPSIMAAKGGRNF